jgi:hypothetical protein
MRVLLSCVIALCLAAVPVKAGAGSPGDEKDATTTAKPGDTSKDKVADTSSASKNDSSAKPGVSTMENELQQLRDLLEAQARQLQLQNEQLREQQQKMEAMEAELKTVNVSVSNAMTSNVSVPASASLGSSAGNTAVVTTRSGGEGDEAGPISIRFKGVTLTPGGFFAAETVFRTKGIADDINTNFKNVPFPGASGSQLTELNFSGRQSRISLLAEGKLSNVTLRGYYETDFLSAGVTSNNNESNSYTLRQRQFYAQAAFENGITVTGGQMWSLVAETRKGLDNRTEASPTTIDAQYTAGFSWARQYALRVTKNFGNKFWLGASIEGPQTLFGGKLQTQNTLIAAPGDTGGLFNNQANYSFNKTPDFIVKAAWEPGWGHYEVFGILSDFRTRIFPCVGATTAVPCKGVVGPGGQPIAFSNSGFGANNNSITGGGIGGNARFPFFDKKVELALHGVYGYGIGRYGTSTLADVTAHPDGTLVGLHNGQALVTLEFHPTKTIDLYAYGGGEYAGRAAYVNGAGSGVGYGSPLLNNFGCFFELTPTNQNTPTAPANCQGDIRDTLEGTVGFWHKFYSGPKGRMQWGLQYSYFVRETWRGVGSGTVGGGTGQTGLAVVTNGQPTGIDNMFFTSFRYYLP